VIDEGDRPQFTGISMRELEFGYRANADGAESSVDSDDSDDYATAKKKKKRAKKRKRPAEEGGADSQLTDQERMARAAFGGGCAAGTEDEEEDEEDEEEEDEGVEVEGTESVAESSVVPEKRLLPIRGESCVGCCYDRAIIEKVDDFVHKNCVQMSETALFKAAALYYKNAIVRPRAAEGVRLPKWTWKSLRSHYVLHVVDPVLQRAAAVRTLGSIRAVQENSLLKVNADGTKQLDHKATEMLLKVVALQEKTIATLDSARMPPPPPRR
jgi:hypothetical protein